MEFKFEENIKDGSNDSVPESGNKIGDFIYEMNRDDGMLKIWGDGLGEYYDQLAFNQVGKKSRKEKEADSQRMAAREATPKKSVEQVSEKITSYIAGWAVDRSMTKAESYAYWKKLRDNLQIYGRPKLMEALDKALKNFFGE
ncbi:MAG: hypothetical protein PHS79_01645 [Patescibacteria group bacterium]|nr:hypothetical protein [Patescibacteria group bacterium]